VATRAGVTAPAMICAGCGYRAPAREAFPLRCPRADSDSAEHVMIGTLHAGGVRFEEHPNPFMRFRTRLYPHALALALGATDERYTDAVERLDGAVARVAGRGFAATPCGRAAALSASLGFREPGGVWVKDETGNVAGSHKARHLMALAVHLTLMEDVGAPWRGTRDPLLGIASCGNAALAAAVVAAAAGRRLEVFVPQWADRALLARLGDLGARVIRCPREAGAAGDPSYRRLRQALEDDVYPFTCQGSLNGLAPEGGKTLAYEMVSTLRREHGDLDRIFIQVGGGALASACISALRDAVGLGLLPRLPRVHAVQTRAVHPLERAYRAIRRRILDRLGQARGVPPSVGAGDQAQADAIVAAARPSVLDELTYAARHRAEFMWPWEGEARSVAGGIVDDETYDWLAVVGGMLETGGYPVLVDDDTIVEATRLARRTTGVRVSPTGAAGLAGLLVLCRRGAVGPQERVGVIFTGIAMR
jgi:threonine synthase